MWCNQYDRGCQPEDLPFPIPRANNHAHSGPISARVPLTRPGAKSIVELLSGPSTAPGESV